MKNRLYLVRHGENPANISKVFSSNIVDQTLTPKGVLQARQTAEWFRNRKLENRQWAECIHSSPLKRAVKTAEIVAEALKRTLCLDEAFREINVGSLEKGQSTPADWAFHQQVVGQWFDGNDDVCFPGGESYTDLWRRFKRGLLHATDSISGKGIIIIGHGGIMTVMLKDLCPEIDIEWLRASRWDNCGITEIDLERTGDQLYGRMAMWNQLGHLSGEAAELIPGLPEDI